MIGATDKLRRLRIGRISAHEEFEGLADESAGNLDWDFLERLHASGRVAADLWLRQDMPQGASRLGPLGGGRSRDLERRPRVTCVFDIDQRSKLRFDG